MITLHRISISRSNATLVHSCAKRGFQSSAWIIDAGCGSAAWLLDLARALPGVNIVGLELRTPIVQTAQSRVRSAALPNLAVLKANLLLDTHWRAVFDAATGGGGVGVRALLLTCPDPFFKAGQAKRRVWRQPAVLSAPTDVLFVRSDVPSAIVDAEEVVEQSGAWQLENSPEQRRALYNTYFCGLLSDREASCVL